MKWHILRLKFCLLAPLMLQGCNLDTWGETCIDAAERLGGPLAIKFSWAPEFAGGADLCGGIDRLMSQDIQGARTAFEAALEAAPSDKKSIAMGYLARTLVPTDGSAGLAYQYWNEAISGAASDKNLNRENLFRADRGSLHAERKNWDLALTDFRKVYSTSDIPALRTQIAFYALGATVGLRDLASSGDWYKKLLEEAGKLGDFTKIAHATEIYGQLLDETGQFSTSDKLYSDAVTMIGAKGDAFLHGELLEFHAQSRLAAGDFESGEELFNRAIDQFNRAGRSDYAQDLERRLQTARGRHDADRRCDLPGVVPSNCD